MVSLTQRYDHRIAGVLSCYDRVVITGTLPTVCYADGMTRYLYASGIRIFDFPEFASMPRDRVRERAASVAAAAGVMIATERCQATCLQRPTLRPCSRRRGARAMRRTQPSRLQSDGASMALLPTAWVTDSRTDRAATTILAAVAPAALAIRSRPRSLLQPTVRRLA